jgi:hypothetical protein
MTDEVNKEEKRYMIEFSEEEYESVLTVCEFFKETPSEFITNALVMYVKAKTKDVEAVKNAK